MEGSSNTVETQAATEHAFKTSSPIFNSPRVGGKFRIFILEDHVFIRESIIHLINRQGDLICCGNSDSVVSASFMIAEQQPDLILADVRLRDGEVFELLATLPEMGRPVPVLILSQFEEAIYASKALAAGARGYLMKQEAPQKLLLAIRHVLEGRVYVSAAMEGQIRKVLLDPA
jgi:DNA-binding NarL/FixJ family response regulator